MATVADLYASVLGRDVSQIDPEGLAYWTQMFGPTVDENEAATFKSVAQVTEPEKVAAVAAAVDESPAPSAPAALTVDDLYKTFYGNIDPTGAAYWKQQFGSSVDPREQAEFIKEVGNYDPNLNTGITVEKAFKDYLGNNTDQAGINYWKQQFGTGNLTADQLSQITNAAYGISEGDDGLFGTGISTSDLAKAAALYYGGSALVDALGAGAVGTNTAGTSLLDYSLPSSTGGLGLKGAAALDGTLASGLAAPAAGSLGGGLGLTAGTAANLAAMGGAQGLLANAAGGGTLSSTGVNTGLFTAESLAKDLAAAAPAAASSLTASQVIKALPLIPVINQLTGDPLGLNPDLPTTTTPGGTSGNPIVPIPPEWKPPTYPGTNLTGPPNYTGAFKPIDLNSIFTDQNLLTGTQWQGLPNQRNMTFNDIFAAGQQSTPMGSPVNINNLVSAILGQTATSQKPA